MKAYCYYKQLIEGQFVDEPRIRDRWITGWQKRGWETVILGEDDARRHPSWEWYTGEIAAFPSINFKDYEQSCWVRWLALSAAMQPGEVAVFSDYDVVNLSFTPVDAMATYWPAGPVNLDEAYGGGPFIVSKAQADAIPPVMITVTKYLRLMHPHAVHWADMEVWKAHQRENLGWVRHAELCKIFRPGIEAKLVHLANRPVWEAKTNKLGAWQSLEPV